MKRQSSRQSRQMSMSRPDVTVEATMLFFEALQHPLEASVWQGDMLSVVSGSVDPIAFNDSEEFRDAYWGVESWSKYPFDIHSINREDEAMKSFFLAEDRCRVANGNLTDWMARPRPSWMRSAVRKARSLLRDTLSGIHPGEVILASGWGPGSTTALPRKRASPQNKWVNASHITSAALPWYEALIRVGPSPVSHGPGYGRLSAVQEVDFNLVTNVPKNAKTDRTIAVEPCWNSFFQHGLGTCIRRRLQRRGLLRPDAQYQQQRFAQTGSQNIGSYVTLDLKGASDSVSLALCELLLPDDLNRMLLSLRSPKGLVGNREVTYEKLSSMGNGSTFEVETALFWAVSEAVCGDAHVYGDDIIVPARRAPMLIELLVELGMEINPKKSFIVGHFRESCGGHYFKGMDVTPPYFRKKLNSLPALISAGNKLLRRCGVTGYHDDRFRELYRYLTRSIPRCLYGPDGFGDAVLVSPWDVARPSWHRSFQCWRTLGLQMTDTRSQADPQGALFHHLWAQVPGRVQWEPSHKALAPRFVKIFTDRWDVENGWLA